MAINEQELATILEGLRSNLSASIEQQTLLSQNVAKLTQLVATLADGQATDSTRLTEVTTALREVTEMLTEHLRESDDEPS